MSKTIYFAEPPLPGDLVLKLAQRLAEQGYSLKQTDEDVLVRLGAGDLLREIGVSKTLRLQLLTEAVLPDNTPRDVLLDTLRYQLAQCAGLHTLLVVDPYLFPAQPDPTYKDDLVSLLRAAASAGLAIEIATKANRNTALQAAVVADIQQINPSITPSFKYTDAFHDRFWIADGARGVFMGTSLNGIGRRYAIADYLAEEDARAIAHRYAALT
ncbi:MAG: hypothetical protein Q8L66_02470 [Caulobacter sp.]|nr:hypothetical protein [Caulobacter sp.]